jgi:hypothetical protein
MSMAYNRLAGVLVLALAATACGSPLLSLGSSLGPTLVESLLPAGSGERGQLVAEIVEVDEVQRRIRVTTDDGRTGTVLYDTNTMVVRAQQHTTVKSLSPGEQVVIQVREADGHVYASRLDVQPADEPEDGEEDGEEEGEEEDQEEEEPPQGTAAPTGSLARIWVSR